MGHAPKAPGGPGLPVDGQQVGGVLQPGAGRIDGQHYLPSEPDAVRWGYVPSVGVVDRNVGVHGVIDKSHFGL